MKKRSEVGVAQFAVQTARAPGRSTPACEARRFAAIGDRSSLCMNNPG